MEMRKLTTAEEAHFDSMPPLHISKSKLSDWIETPSSQTMTLYQSPLSSKSMTPVMNYSNDAASLEGDNDLDSSVSSALQLLGNSQVESTLFDLAGKKDEWASMSAKDKAQILDELLALLELYADEFLEAALCKRGGVPFSPSPIKDWMTLSSTQRHGNEQPRKSAGKKGKGNQHHKEAAVQHPGDSREDEERMTEQETETAFMTAWLNNTLHSSGLLSIWLRVIKDMYDHIAKYGFSPEPADIFENEDGSWRIRVGPDSILQKLMLTFGTLDLHVEPDGLARQVPTSRKPGVMVILGAGNFDAPIEILHSLFIDNHVCVYKLSPMSACLMPMLQILFAPLVSRGFTILLQDQEGLGKELVNHPLVDKWILTGSKKTAYQIIWGQPYPPSVGSSMKLTPAGRKEMLLELGSCSPWIVCPGVWSEMALKRHAMLIVSSMLWNGGHVCVHPQVVITSLNWPQRKDFLDLIRQSLKIAKFCGVFYPQSEGKTVSYKSRLEEEVASTGGSIYTTHVFADGGAVAHAYRVHRMTSIKTTDNPNLDATDLERSKKSVDCIVFADTLPHDSCLLKEEVFVPTSGEICLDVSGDDIGEFLEAAVEFVNTKCEGQLSCAISVKTDSRNEDAVAEAIAKLKYGTISINTDPKMPLCFPCLTWGGYPNTNLYDIQSGVGRVRGINSNC